MMISRKGIVHFEISFSIQDVGVFVSILIFLGQTVHREVQIKHDLMTRKCKYTLRA